MKKGKATPGSGRAQRVAERIREELGNFAVSGEMHDPSLSGLVVTRTWVSEDLQIARVYVRLFDVAGEPSEQRRKNLLRALGRASGRIQGGIGRRMKLRRTPTLQFYWDDELERVRRIDGILDEIRQDGTSIEVNEPEPAVEAGELEP